MLIEGPGSPRRSPEINWIGRVSLVTLIRDPGSPLQAFTVRAEAEGRWERKCTPAQTSSLPVGSDLQRGVRQRELDDVVSLVGRCP